MHVTFRPLAGPEELPRFLHFPYDLNSEVADDLTAGRRRPAWLWIATRGDEVLARAGWWSRPGAPAPYLMDFLDFAPGEDGTAETLVKHALSALVPAGQTPPEYIRFVPPDWARDPQGVPRTVAVLQRLGAHLLVERLRLEWRPGTPIAAPARLRFRPFASTAEALDLMTRAVAGTLDAHDRADLATMTPRAVAEEHFHGELERWPSPQSWWRVATLDDGAPVGFVFPARNDYGPIIAYIAVLPEHRGHGYIDDLLAEGTRVLAESGDIPRIRASTDVGNTPMAAAFARAGYVNYQNELNMTW
ncbi:GNAT family N-acetyltransferase [Dactylosporangium matsuzakiense]|uniref:N-acetyltransferase n=1 Tax=Dactylosporangium matsuzakiense TaxID=53360 RepID=A0A9W6NML1_9ACTN|nr:GNAT family N-acetyltransferase [Dactylosporangium matsuzakiense]UWZ41631.1 GNAT family N-acetyltransferase [Dactylosporangium matsuzakiense]GLL02293.1 N-acetyltransferase [Dactylosporangium matsuzakiense]